MEIAVILFCCSFVNIHTSKIIEKANERMQ